MIEQTPIRHKGSPPGLSAGGWLTAARACPSPNCDARPDEDDISLLVIHNISLPPGQFGGAYIDQMFTNTLDATAHPYLDRKCVVYGKSVSVSVVLGCCRIINNKPNTQENIYITIL